jgi:hypothetical protein
MEDPKEFVLKVVRGERPLSDLKTAGVSLQFRKIDEESRSREIIVSPSGDSAFTIAPAVADLAKGLLFYKGRPKELRDWGSFVLGADLLDLEPLESEPQGDLILNGVWDASFEGEFSQEVAEAVLRLTR